MVEFGAVCHLCHGNCKIRIGNTQKIGDGMTIFNFISLFGGLALFLYGMQLMGDGLKKGSSGALKAAMEKVTNNPLVGFLLGLAGTAGVVCWAAGTRGSPGPVGVVLFRT